MKKKSICFLMVVFILFLACKQKDDVGCTLTDFEIRKQQIVGKWAVRSVYKYYSNDSLIQKVWYGDLDYQFFEDGTGLLPNFYNDEGDDKLEWIYQYNPEKMVYRRLTDGGKPSSEDLHSFWVLKNEIDYQHWFLSDTTRIFTIDSVYDGHIEIDMELFRK